MTSEEADRILAEYMGWYKQPTDRYPEAWNNKEGFRVDQSDWFSRSLDSLVPVWEKLSGNLIITIQENWVDWNVSLSASYYRQGNEGKTIQEAAAIATAKAIQELRG